VSATRTAGSGRTAPGRPQCDGRQRVRRPVVPPLSADWGP
jgi:hypothetical protein